MLKIDDNLLQQIGLGSLPAEEKRGLLSHIYETLEMRVGMRLADQMTNEQLDEFEQYFEAKDDAGAFKWLESNFPNYKEIVNEEFEKLKGEVAQTAPQILSASQQNLAAHPLQPQIPSTQSQPAAMPPQTGQPGQQAWSAQAPPPQQPDPASVPQQPQAWQQPTRPQQQPAGQSQPYQMPQEAPQPSYQPQPNPTPGQPPQGAPAQPYTTPPQPQQPWSPPPQQPLPSDQQPPQAA